MVHKKNIIVNFFLRILKVNLFLCLTNLSITPWRRMGEVDVYDVYPSVDFVTSWRWVVSFTGWVGRRTGLDDVERRKIFPYKALNSNPSAAQAVASRNTDWAVPAPLFFPWIYEIRNLCHAIFEPGTSEVLPLEPVQSTAWGNCGVVWNNLTVNSRTAFYIYSVPRGARGSVFAWGSMLQAGRSLIRVPMRWIYQLT
jgi:hypothetical protein